MELTPVQRIATFAVVVLVLAGLGVYLFLPKRSGAAPDRPNPAASTVGGGPGSPPARPTAPVSSPTTSPSPSPVAAGQSPDIYNWLPFTPSGLASAARVTTAFAVDYGTFSYRQSTSSYLAPMNSLISTQLAALIGRAYSAPGVVSTRNSTKQVSVGSATITSLRAYGPSSLTFVVNL